MSLATIIANHPRRALRFELPTVSSEARQLASTNFERNRAALHRAWPRTVLALPDSLPQLEWLFTRDDVLSGRHVDRRWFNDISVPRRSAERMLKRLSIVGTTAVMLAPTHAAQIRRALELLTPNQALIVIIPGEFNAGVITACEDFTADIAVGRLWLAVGPDWGGELKAILDGNEGLNPPSTMIRVPGLNAPVVELVSRPIEGLLSAHSKAHRQIVSIIHGKTRTAQRPVRRACVVASNFSLWNDAGHLLGEAAANSSVECETIDASSPTQASDLFLARAADRCDVVVTANVGRADRPGIVSAGVPWVTWVTGSTVPAVGGADDRLVVADLALHTLAIAEGWLTERVTIASEPWHERTACGRDADAIPAIIFDLPAIAAPASIEEMSSLRLVWEIIERELTGRALTARGDIDATIYAIADRVGVPRESVPLDVFRDQLVRPLFAREAALELAASGIDFAIYGEGWDAFPTLASLWRGPVRTATEWSSCLTTTTAVLDVWPGVASHASKRTGRPVVSMWGSTPTQITAALKRPIIVSHSATTFDLDRVFDR